MIWQLVIAEDSDFRFTQIDASMVVERLLIFCIATVLLSGCASNRVPESWLAGKPNMQFSQSAIYSYTSKMMPQFQPGLAGSGGAQPSTCTACR